MRHSKVSLNEYIYKHFKPSKKSSANDLRVYEKIKDDIEGKTYSSHEFSFLVNRCASPFAECHELQQRPAHYSLDPELKELLLDLAKEAPQQQKKPIQLNENPPNYKDLDKSFAEMLYYWLDVKDMQAPDLYKRANINKQTFSRIISQPNNPPIKPIALACAIALRLNLAETKDLLKRAGYALSDSIITDVIVHWHIVEKIYDIDIINKAILDKDGILLGSRMR